MEGGSKTSSLVDGRIGQLKFWWLAREVRVFEIGVNGHSDLDGKGGIMKKSLCSMSLGKRLPFVFLFKFLEA